MSDGLLFRKLGGALVPIDDDASAWLAKRKGGAAVVIEPVQVRNAEMSALYHVLCGLVAENHPDLTSKQAVDECLRNLAGHFDTYSYVQPDGRRKFIQRAKSIAFARMRQDEFELFFDAALRNIEAVLLPGVDVEELRKEAYVRSGTPRK